jgi:hypothetical protein
MYPYTLVTDGMVFGGWLYSPEYNLLWSLSRSFSDPAMSYTSSLIHLFLMLPDYSKFTISSYYPVTLDLPSLLLGPSIYTHTHTYMHTHTKPLFCYFTYLSFIIPPPLPPPVQETHSSVYCWILISLQCIEFRIRGPGPVKEWLCDFGEIA